MVLASIFFLTGLASLSLEIAGRKSSALVCLKNMESISAAWIMYANDNNGQLVLNPDGSDGGKLPAKPSWAGGWLDFTASSDNTNSALLQGTENRIGGLLGGYVSDAKIYKCPEDPTFTVVNSQKIARVRSISLNSFLGGVQTQNGNRLNTYNDPRYLRFVKKSDLSAVLPSSQFQFIEECPESINDGCFSVSMSSSLNYLKQLTPQGYRIVDFPAAFHENGAALSFVDGHAELWTWRDVRTSPSHPANSTMQHDVSSTNNFDVGRIVLGASTSL